MLIIADKRLPAEVLNSLSACGELLLMAASGTVYDTISGHPDIFFCMINDTLCVSPGLDDRIYKKLDSYHIRYICGKQMPGEKYPATAAYNMAICGNAAIHNFNITDGSLKTLAANYNKFHVQQGYSRCNIIPLDGNSLITSDAGIHKVVNAAGMDTLLVTTENILLPGFDHGFIGGCCGVHDKTVYFTGCLSYHPQGREIKEFIGEHGFAVTELYNGPLFDGGSLIFIP